MQVMPDRPVNYRAIAEELEVVARTLREQHDEERAARILDLATKIREEQRLPPGFRQNDL
jgi:hypothetical protein